jgi:hypothetical protein
MIRFIVLCGDHLCKFVVNKPLSVSFLSICCVRTIEAILIQGSGSACPNSRSPYYLFALIHVRPGFVHPTSAFVRPDRICESFSDEQLQFIWNKSKYIMDTYNFYRLLIQSSLPALLIPTYLNDKAFFPTIYQEILSRSGPNARCVTPEKDRFITINMIIHLCSFFKSYPYSATQSREFKILCRRPHQCFISSWMGYQVRSP